MDLRIGQVDGYHYSIGSYPELVHEPRVCSVGRRKAIVVALAIVLKNSTVSVKRREVHILTVFPPAFASSRLTYSILGFFKMRLSHAQALLLAPLSAQAIRIVLSNDDGWAAKTVRVFFDTLTAAGQNVVLSGPAENKSGTSIPHQNNNHCATRANI